MCSTVCAAPGPVWRGTSLPRGRREPSAPANTSRRSSPTAISSPSRRCNARHCTPTGSGRTASRVSGTSTFRGSTTSATPTPWPPSTTSTPCTSCACSTKTPDAPISRRRGYHVPSSNSLISWASPHLPTWPPRSRWPNTRNWTRTTSCSPSSRIPPTCISHVSRNCARSTGNIRPATLHSTTPGIWKGS